MERRQGRLEMLAGFGELSPPSSGPAKLRQREAQELLLAGKPKVGRLADRRPHPSAQGRRGRLSPLRRSRQVGAGGDGGRRRRQLDLEHAREVRPRLRADALNGGCFRRQSPDFSCPSDAGGGYGAARKRRQSIPSFRMRARRVWGLIASFRAAPKGPSIRPKDSRSAVSIWRAIAPSSVGSEGASGAAGRGSVRDGRVRAGAPAPSAFTTSSRRPSPRMAARSMTAASSRTLPGQGYAAQQRQVCGCRQRAARAPSRAPARAREVRGERRDVLGALAQRRQTDGEDADAVPEVLAEPALLRPSSGRSRCVAATIRTSTVSELVPADALERAVLEDAQQAHLRGERAARRSRRGTACRRRRARTSPCASRSRR